MLLILTSFLVGFGFAIREYFDDLRYFDLDVSFRIVSIMMSILLGGMVGALAAGVVGLIPATEVYEWSKSEIAALQDTSSADGSFLLGTGHVDGEFYYFYYEQCGDHCFVFRKLRASHAVVIEDSPDVPYVQTFAVRFRKRWWDWVAVPLFVSEYAAKIHILIGSVKQGFKLDFQ